MKKWHMIVDLALCQGCNNCALACKDEHVGNDWPGYTRAQSRSGERWIHVPCRERGKFPIIDVTYRPTVCTHCGDAPCIFRSQGAIRKRPDGLVEIEAGRAAGNRALVDACPYGMISWSEQSQAAQKCTLCAHLLDDGWQQPRCVQACGPGALTFVRATDEEFRRMAASDGLQTLHPGRIEDTAVVYKNLSRFTDCFIAGSVATDADGLVDCATGVKIGLLDSRGELAAECVTDSFGDFKIDRLRKDSGEYTLLIGADQEHPTIITVRLGESVNVGTVLLGTQGVELLDAAA